jgi:hypothetical protein
MYVIFEGAILNDFSPKNTRRFPKIGSHSSDKKSNGSFELNHDLSARSEYPIARTATREAAQSDSRQG